MRYQALALIAAPVFAQAEPLSVVTDIPPVHSLISQVLGDRGDVSVLLGQNADPHHFQLRPSQSRDLANSDLLIWIGEEMTPWLARARDGVAADVPSLAFLELETGEGHGEDDHDDGHDEDGHDDGGEEHDDDHGHGHDGVDPHIWLSTHEAEMMLHEIAEHLGELDPEGAEIYEANADAALERIEALEHEIEHAIEDVLDVPFVVGHDAYGHFVDQFGLNAIDSLADVHDSAPSAKHVSELIELAEQGKIACVFPEIGESTKLAETLAAEGVRLGAALDPAGSALQLGPELHSQLLINLANNLKDCLDS